MSGEFLEIPTLVEAFRTAMKAVENHGHERERLSGHMTVLQCLSQQSIAESMALELPIDAKPGQYRYWKRATGKAFG